MEDTTRTAELRRKLEKDPGSRLFAQFAEELRKEGRHEEAINVARKGLEKNPNYPSARLTLARSLQDSGRPGEARPELELVVKASPDNILAGRLLGEVLEELGQFPEAIAQFENTLRFAPGDKAIVEKIAAVKVRMQASAAPPPAPPAPLTFEAPSVPSVPGLEAPSVPSVLGLEAPSVSMPDVPMPAVAFPSVSFSEPSLPAVALPEAALPSIPVPELPSVLVAEPPSVSVSELPSLTVAELPALAARAVPLPSPAPPVPAPPVPSVALDRDLASGTLSPGTFKVSDLNFDAPPAPGAPENSLSLPPADDDSDLGAQTLPLTSITLADLYLQQGLKAEASAVLSQVMREEPENVRAKSKFEAVARDLEAPALADPSATEPAPPMPPLSPAGPAAVTAAPVKRTAAEMREQTILSLKAFQSAIEREALQQRATEQRPF